MEETPSPPPEEAPPPEASATPPEPPPPATPPPTPGMPPPAPTFTPPVTGMEAPPGGYTTGTTAKTPILSLILSLVIPGLGQIINGDTTKGIVYVIAWFTCFIVIGFVLVPAIIAYAAYDAFQGAKKWNVAHGYPAGA